MAGEVMVTTGAGISETLDVADAELPAASVATTEIVFAPEPNVAEQLNAEMFSCAARPLHVTEETPDNESLTVPEIVACEEKALDPVAGDTMVTVGGVLSTLTATDAVAEFPAMSVAGCEVTIAVPSLVTGIGGGQLATPLRLSLH